ncbi:phosphoserine transaminase [[Clostridium] symbiosum ATCC 14940]|uniref:Phosphoserine aminotransferase n=3 Tax=Clostridium symbiosum TaxID=1512 RepID=A0ABC9U0X6_CLOSY|nr:phosphoserine transaminase [[Clostridium] symbiosum ATCC 14940]
MFIMVTVHAAWIVTNHEKRYEEKEEELSMSRVYNFSAGPAVLPEEVLKEAAEEMLDYKGCGMSVMEMSHRSKDFQDIIDEAEKDLRELMNIPDNYKVLFVQGGGHVQFAMVPMNLMKNKVGDYIITGQWAKKAYTEAKLFGTANAVASSADRTFSYIPDCSDLPIDENADYVYICLNNTIYGTVYHELPNTKGKTLVADISSCFLSEPIDVSKFGILWGGVQKNVGPAGVAIVIIREDLITEDVLPGTPTMLRYKTYADNDSLFNTPPTYTIYMCGKVFKWLKKMGGLEVMKERNEKKAKILYDFLDESRLFRGTARKKDRSLMNVPFVTGDEELDALFVKEAKAAGFVNLKGHRTVGGMRASIYNAMPIEGVEALVEFMREFEKKHAK